LFISFSIAPPPNGSEGEALASHAVDLTWSRAMGCIFALIALLSPRLAVFLLWAFTNYVNRAFSGGWFLPLLGIIIAPWTTLMYVLVYAPAGPIHVAGWILVGIGVVLDLNSWAHAAANRRSVPGYN
jgi:hypothetical protein